MPGLGGDRLQGREGESFFQSENSGKYVNAGHCMPPGERGLGLLLKQGRGASGFLDDLKASPHTLGSVTWNDPLFYYLK